MSTENRWVLLPLRMFLGVTFLYAGFQKLADRWFFESSAPSSLASQLRAASHSSPIGGLTGGLAHEALLLGLVIAFGEIGVGLGTLVGLWARPAAAAGLLLSLGFLLTVSWHSHPYYYGADIVFVFAWSPLLIGGAGPLSFDAMARAAARASLRLTDDRPMPGGKAAQARADAEVDRRTLLRQAGAAGWLAGGALLAGGTAAVLGRLIPPGRSTVRSTPQLAAGPSSTTAAPVEQTTTVPDQQATTTAAPTVGPTTPPTTPTTPPTTAPATAPTTAAAKPPGAAIGPASDVPVGGAAQFTDPSTGDPAYVLQPRAGTFVAFSAVCTHAGCTVEYAGSIFQCPCHGAQFATASGNVLRGPARQPLRQIGVQEAGDGTLYAT